MDDNRSSVRAAASITIRSSIRKLQVTSNPKNDKIITTIANRKENESGRENNQLSASRWMFKIKMLCTLRRQTCGVHVFRHNIRMETLASASRGSQICGRGTGI